MTKFIPLIILAQIGCSLNRVKSNSVLIAVLLILSCQKNTEKTLRIATAANMQFVMTDLLEAFTSETGIVAEMIVSSSGKLTAQIKEGAPYDVFVSADMKYPKALYEVQLTTKAPEIYAYGKLVLWSNDADIKPSLSMLSTDAVEHIAMANPKIAPYGKAAMEVLEYYNLVDSVKAKLVYGESIAQCNQFILTQAAEIGFTTQSTLFSPQLRNNKNWIYIDKKSYQPIEQGIVILKQRRDFLDQANVFYNFLLSEKAQQILKQYGYEI